MKIAFKDGTWPEIRKGIKIFQIGDPIRLRHDLKILLRKLTAGQDTRMHVNAVIYGRRHTPLPAHRGRQHPMARRPVATDWAQTLPADAQSAFDDRL